MRGREDMARPGAGTAEHISRSRKSRFTSRETPCWSVERARPGSGESRARFGIEEIRFEEWEKLCWGVVKAR